MSADLGPIAGVTAAYWLESFRYLGFGADALYWYTSASADATLAGSPVSTTIDQNRVGLFLSVLGRVFLGGPERPYLYGGLGGGVVYSAASPGGSNVGPGFSGLLGVAFPLTDRLRLKGEVRYLVTKDVDGSPTTPDVSGSPRTNPANAVFGPHFDTQFLPIMLGLEWRF